MSGGITIAGNIIVDIVNIIDKYPNKHMLAVIRESSKAVGGCVPNTLIDIAKIDPAIPLAAAGMISDDDNGAFVLEQLKAYNIDTSLVEISNDYVTSRDYVMTELRSGDRTFFYEAGANAWYAAEQLPDKLKCDIFHIGYILLLDELDKADKEYGTRMARLLHDVQKKGIKTSIDVVSEEGDRFSEKVIPALKYCDYTFMNEIECCAVSGLPVRRPDGTLNIDNIKKSMVEFFEYGVREKVIVHAAEGGFMLDSDGSFIASGSLIIPEDMIAGSVGAGDAYTAACLYGIYNGCGNMETLEFAAAAAACSLTEKDSVGGMRSKTEIEAISKRFERRMLEAVKEDCQCL